MKRLITFLTILLLTALHVLAQSTVWQFKVEHIRTLRNQHGTVTVDNVGIKYKSDREKRSLAWTFSDIQQLTLEPPYFEILTYEDQKWKLGKDRIYRFKILEGSIDARLSDFLRQRMTGTFVTAIVPEASEEPEYRVPVKHRLVLGGSEGILEVYDDRVVYRSQSSRDSRVWTYRQIESFAFPSAREFELQTDEKEFGGPTRTFRFYLKEALPDSAYDFLWMRIHGSSYFPSGRRPATVHSTVGGSI
ncbi:MAG TPA: hypothetical protein VGQ81_06795 [Acidobacteriota bacterium]|jgi:hypothetical protein|nr:hypothetical protein [Acidobacteriota bacterium]